MATGQMVERVAEPRWSRYLVRFEAGVFGVEKWICILALAVMVAAVFTTILVRNLNLPWPNFGEWALVSVIPLTFIGAAMCTYLGSHIAVDALRLIGIRHIVTLSRLLTAGGNACFSGVFIYSGWFVFNEALTSGEQMLELGTPLALPLLFIPVGMGLMLFHSLMDMLAIFFPSLERQK